MRLILLCCLVLAPLCGKGQCEVKDEEFNKFLKDNNPYRGLAATLDVAARQFGAPTSVVEKDYGKAAYWQYSGCYGEVLIGEDRKIYMTNVRGGQAPQSSIMSPPREAPVASAPSTDLTVQSSVSREAIAASIDKRIAELESVLLELRQLRRALGVEQQGMAEGSANVSSYKNESPTRQAVSQSSPTSSTAGPETEIRPGEAYSGTTTATGAPIYVGPRGGRYHYSSSGKKVYERKK